MSELLGIAPSIFLVGMMALLIRGAAGAAGGGGGKGGMFQMGKSKAKRIKKEDITVTFKVSVLKFVILVKGFYTCF